MADQERVKYTYMWDALGSHYTKNSFLADLKTRGVLFQDLGGSATMKGTMGSGWSEVTVYCEGQGDRISKVKLFCFQMAQPVESIKNHLDQSIGRSRLIQARVDEYGDEID